MDGDHIVLCRDPASDWDEQWHRDTQWFVKELTVEVMLMLHFCHRKKREKILAHNSFLHHATHPDMNCAKRKCISRHNCGQPTSLAWGINHCEHAASLLWFLTTTHFFLLLGCFIPSCAHKAHPTHAVQSLYRAVKLKVKAQGKLCSLGTSGWEQHCPMTGCQCITSQFPPNTNSCKDAKRLGSKASTQGITVCCVLKYHWIHTQTAGCKVVVWYLLELRFAFPIKRNQDQDLYHSHHNRGHPRCHHNVPPTNVCPCCHRNHHLQHLHRRSHHPPQSCLRRWSVPSSCLQCRSRCENLDTKATWIKNMQLYETWGS